MQAPAFNPSGNGAGGAGDDGFADEVLVSINVRDWARTESARSQMTHISEPVEVACFSRSGDRQVAFGSRAGLQKFQDPRINVRLDDGFHRFVPKDEREGSGVEEVVSCLRAAGFSVDDEADIVTYRNNLNKIGGAPYNHRDPFEFDAVRVGRTCFVDIRKLEERPPSERHRRFMYMGYKFEALCSAGVHEPAPVNANSEFCAAMRIRIANHRIVLMAEIDAELPSAGGEPDARRKNSFIELKTTRRPLSDRDRETLYLKKYQQWFLQSYLAGIRTIFVGLRDDSGMLVDVDHVGTKSLPRAAKAFAARMQAKGDGAKECWEPFVCINFIEHVAEQVRRACGEHPGDTVRFSFDPETGTLAGRLLAGDASLSSRIRRVSPAPGE